MYQHIDGHAWRHIYIVGDLHGCLQVLMARLREVHFDPWQDLLISVGDLIDRGPDSPGCLALLGKKWFRAVMGNHEAMALECLESGHTFSWSMNGGEWYYQLDHPERRAVLDDLARCVSLPLVLELQTRGKTIVVAHADYPADSYQWEQPVERQVVLWSRTRIQHNIQGKGTWISGADAFYFGHTPIQAPLHFHNQHYIDTGAVFGNTLTLVAVQ